MNKLKTIANKGETMKALLFLSMVVISFGGCGILQDVTSGGGGDVLPDGTLDQADIRNWDLSPCFEDSDSFDVCFNLFWNNKDMILNGEELIPNLGQLNPGA